MTDILEIKKISNTLKKREEQLTDKEKEDRTQRLNSYWKNMTPEERSERNTKNCLIAMKNNDNKLVWQSKDEYLLYNELLHRGYKVCHQFYQEGFLFDLAVLYNNSITLIELNGEYWHNYRPFKNTKDNIEEYNKMIKQSTRTQRIANKWRYEDVSKYNYCVENNLNYIAIYFNNQIKNNVDNVCDKIISKLNNGVQIILSEDLNN